MNVQKSPTVVASTNAAESLVDSFGRRIDYLRVSVTDRCDLRCNYCLPEGFRDFATRSSILSPDEIARLVGIFSSMGVSRVRLTGGEPLVRADIVEIARLISAKPGIQDLSLSTNATQLAHFAFSLRDAGVSRLNVSLDSLDRDRFRHITGSDRLECVLAGLAEARRAGFSPIKLNMVVLNAESVSEIEAMWLFARENGFVLRVIEGMPVGFTAQSMSVVDLHQWVRQFSSRQALVPQVSVHGGPARYWHCTKSGSSIGVITPMSQHFCADCNRVRLTAEGVLLLCLGQEDRVDLRSLLRAGADDDEIKRSIRTGISAKPERHHFGEQPAKIVRFMAQTGG
ncbi:GTP 3',8-cyclase MoaA [Uliginosibacterium flavum]|uniref:GTP 3',8-cyclase n=1 Tax=Uliginosibacterium flavum TaxID=1396831 RepID=A0ABV2TRA3_9RHOO